MQVKTKNLLLWQIFWLIYQNDFGFLRVHRLNRMRDLQAWMVYDGKKAVLSVCPIPVRIVLRLTIWRVRNSIIDQELAVSFYELWKMLLVKKSPIYKSK